MIVTWSPIRSNADCVYSQEQTDILSINGTQFDFSDQTVVEFDLPEETEEHGWIRNYIQRAWREANELHLILLAHQPDGEPLLQTIGTYEISLGVMSW
jgi:hypothetical protein